MKFPKTHARAPHSVCWAFALLGVVAFALPAIAAGSDDSRLSAAAATEESSAGPRAGAIPTREGLQLTFKAVCADLRVFTDSANQVSYAVRLDAKIPAGIAPGSGNPLPDFWLTARQTSRGVLLIAHSQRLRDCDNIVYEIHVPHRYDLNIALQSGAITAQDIDGSVAVSTGGGDLRLGRIGASDSSPTNPAGAPFVAQLETAGGNISVGDIAGGLRAATGGGGISAGDIRGPAILRTGGGEIRVGHVFGAARLASGGGNITAGKIDGGLWAQADGGRVEIGDAKGLSAFTPEFSADTSGQFPPVILSVRSQDPALGRLADINEFSRLFDVFFWGGVRVDSLEAQKHLITAVAPAYPEVARLAGIDGDVTLRVLVGEDGRVRDLRPISGAPVLARAAMRAVEQWQYAPALVDGHPTDVVTTVTFSFRLR